MIKSNAIITTTGRQRKPNLAGDKPNIKNGIVSFVSPILGLANRYCTIPMKVNTYIKTHIDFVFFIVFCIIRFFIQHVFRFK